MITLEEIDKEDKTLPLTPPTSRYQAHMVLLPVLLNSQKLFQFTIQTS